MAGIKSLGEWKWAAVPGFTKDVTACEEALRTAAMNEFANEMLLTDQKSLKKRHPEAELTIELAIFCEKLDPLINQLEKQLATLLGQHKVKLETTAS